MQIGIRLHDIEPGTLEQRVMRAHEQGFTCGHLALAKTVTEHSVANSALTPGYAAYLRKMFAKYDVDIAVLGCYLNLAHPDPEELKEDPGTVFCPYTVCFDSEDAAWWEQRRELPTRITTLNRPAIRKRRFQTFIANVRPVVECAEKFGVILAIEPVWSHIVYDSKTGAAGFKGDPFSQPPDYSGSGESSLCGKLRRL